MRPKAVKHYPSFNMVHYVMGPNNPFVHESGSVNYAFASLILSGWRQAVTHSKGHHDSSYTWDKKKKRRLYTGSYSPGKYEMQAGPEGLDFFCMTQIDKPPPKFNLVEVTQQGSVGIPPGVDVLVAQGSFKLGERELHQYDYLLKEEVAGQTLVGQGDLLLVMEQHR